MQHWRDECNRITAEGRAKDERIAQLESLLQTANHDKLQVQDDLHRVLSRRGDLAALRLMLEQQLVQQAEQQAQAAAIAASAAVAPPTASGHVSPSADTPRAVVAGVGIQVPSPRTIPIVTIRSASPSDRRAVHSPLQSPRMQIPHSVIDAGTMTSPRVLSQSVPPGSHRSELAQDGSPRKSSH